MTNFFIKDILKVKIDELIASKAVIIGLDIGDKTVGVAVSDSRIKIASGLATVSRNGTDRDFNFLMDAVSHYKIGLIIFGWPLQMNGLPGKQCEKTLEFTERLSKYINADFARWDERFSTKVVDDLMIQADLSRKKRKKAVDQSAAVYILQGAIDFLNRNSVLTKQDFL
ncbi:MAG: Holliday junction resolvase RuvX [Holosporaceae bacterium]|jgi:putative Holliday junction resolvase|nr:Holliday junction resolvase RuvX [Holosporaceae bacterium]